MFNTATDFEDRGLQVQVSLKREKRTQRWLLDKLHERGFTTVNEQFLSKILNGKYPHRLGRQVLMTADEILAADRQRAAGE